MKRCATCKEYKEKIEFYKSSDIHRLDGLQSQCKDCSKLSAKNFRIERKKWLQKLKEDTPCKDCGIYYPYYVMQFDHVSGKKKFNLSGKVTQKSMKSILEEIDKCEIVCSNCHHIRTWQRITGASGTSPVISHG